MAWAQPTQITSWSYSRYSTYKQCPLRAKLLYINKMPEPKNAAMDRGNQIHKLAEDFLKGNIARLPAELKAFEVMFKSIKALSKKKTNGVQVIVEDTWAFRKDWTRTEWNDWSGCVLRIKMDNAVLEVPKIGPPTLDINDWKTGKFNPRWGLEDYLEQMELYATGGLEIFGAAFPDLIVRPKLVYLDQSVIYPDYSKPIALDNAARVYTVPDLKGLKKSWEKKTKGMLNDKTFAPRPGDKCRWCSFRKSEGGPCKF